MENRFHVVIVPDMTSAVDARALGLALETDAYSARQLLRGAHPRIARTLLMAYDAHELCRTLAELGAPCFVCTADELRAGYETRKAQAVAITAHGWAFALADGQTDLLRPDTLRLMIEGRVERTEKVETRVERGRLRRLIDPSAARATQTHNAVISPFVHIFAVDRPWAIEIVGDDFDYAGLGASKNYAATVNFRTLAALLRAAAPDAVYDDRLSQRAPAPLPVESRCERIDNGRARQHVEREDNRAVLRQAAALIYLHYAQSWRTESAS